MAKKILVTSALPYANGSIHIGHLVEYIQTDVFVRFLKLIEENAIYCCADDTHGAPIEISAAKLGIKPEELISKYWKEHTEDFSSYLIEFDSYYSTNSDENKHYADLIFSRLKEAGHIYTKETEHTYCEHDKRFLPDRYVKGTCPKCDAEDQYGDVCEKCNSTYSTIDLVKPYCTICKNTPTRKKSTHYYFKLGQYSDFLKDWISNNKELQPEIKNHVLSWIKEGLEDWCISRDGPYFGFKIPGEADKFYYVWLDAPIGYISSTTNYCNQHGGKTEDWWNASDSDIYHFIGKDIIYFHLLFWPAMLKGAGFNRPRNVFVHGFLTVNREKMSKSRGTFLTAKEFLEKGNPEHLRYYYAANLGRSMTDIDLDLKDYADRVNNELVANIANFVYRTLSFTQKNFDSKLTTNPKDSDELIKEATVLYESIKENYRNVQFRQAVQQILQVSTLGNKYLQDKAPWKNMKENPEHAQQVLTVCANLVRNLAILIKPIMPEYSKEIERQLGVKDLKWDDIGFNHENTKIADASIYFKNIEALEFGQEVSPLDLKVAVIEKVEPHPDAEKLYVLSIDLGTEKRTLVAGLKPYYKPEELEGKHIIIVANLEPAKLRGIESQGMLLAAGDGVKVGVLNMPDAPAGTPVGVEGKQPNPAKLSFKEFQALKIEAKGGKALLDGEELTAGEHKLLIDRNIDGKVT